MKVKTERQENCIVQLQISVDEAKETEYLRRAARALSREYRIRGFRPGKAPYDVIVQRLGINMVHGQVVEQFGDEIFAQGLEESSLEPIDQASLQDVTWDPLTLHLEVPVGPEVFLGDYRDLRIEWEPPEITEEEVNDELLRLQKEQSEWRPDDRPAELGDQVVINIVGKVDDEVVLENVNREMVLDAESPYPVPGFAEAIVGMEPGERREFELAYPEDHYNAEIAGKPGQFEVELDEIRVEVLPALDDEFALIVGDYEDLEDLKAKLKESLLEEAEQGAEEAYQEKLWDAVFEMATIEYPEVMVERELTNMQAQFEQRLRQQGIDFETYLTLSGTSEEEWMQEARAQAVDNIKRTLVLGEIIEQEELKVDADEIEAEIDRMLESLGEQAEQFEAMFDSPQGRMSVAEGLLTGKAMDQFVAIARGEDPPKGSELAEEKEDAEADVEDEAETPEEDDGEDMGEAGEVADQEADSAAVSEPSDADVDALEEDSGADGSEQEDSDTEDTEQDHCTCV